MLILLIIVHSLYTTNTNSLLHNTALLVLDLKQLRFKKEEDLRNINCEEIKSNTMLKDMTYII